MLRNRADRVRLAERSVETYESDGLGDGARIRTIAARSSCFARGDLDHNSSAGLQTPGGPRLSTWV
jgi:hypothetical protein